MSYFQGFIIPVPHDNKDDYRKLAEDAVPLFTDYGALRIVECWGDQVPRGEATDFFRAVKAEDGENVVFSWIVWASKEACDEAAGKMVEDERMQDPPAMPFDGKRMVYSGFDPLVELGKGDQPADYVQGYVAPVPEANREAFSAMAGDMAAIAIDHGAVQAIDSWGADLLDGEVTDFKKAVDAKSDETVVFGFTTWPSKDAHAEAIPKMRGDERMPSPGSDMPFDGKRLFFGGFDVLMDTAAKS